MLLGLSNALSVADDIGKHAAGAFSAGSDLVTMRAERNASGTRAAERKRTGRKAKASEAGK